MWLHEFFTTRNIDPGASVRRSGQGHDGIRSEFGILPRYLPIRLPRAAAIYFEVSTTYRPAILPSCIKSSLWLDFL